MFLDGSPQWRQQEFLAASVDVVTYTDQGVRDVYYRSMLPALRIPKAFFKASGKVYSLLWMLWLAFGPTYERMRETCERVISLTTDQGVERLASAHPDMLPEFLRAHKVPLPGDWQRLDRVFPNALQAVGWNHLIDGIARMILTAIPYFATFVKQTKALLKLVRDHGEALFRELRTLNRGANIAKVLSKASPPYFAQWRWGTFTEACDCAVKIAILLQGVWSKLKLGKQIKDSQLTKTVSQALNDARFTTVGLRFKQISEELTWLASWGGGCECHEDFRLRMRVSFCSQHRGQQRTKLFLQSCAFALYSYRLAENR